MPLSSRHYTGRCPDILNFDRRLARLRKWCAHREFRTNFHHGTSQYETILVPAPEKRGGNRSLMVHVISEHKQQSRLQTVPSCIGQGVTTIFPTVLRQPSPREAAQMVCTPRIHFHHSPVAIWNYRSGSGTRKRSENGQVRGPRAIIGRVG